MKAQKPRQKNELYGKDHYHEPKRYHFSSFGYLSDEEIEMEILEYLSIKETVDTKG